MPKLRPALAMSIVEYRIRFMLGRLWSQAGARHAPDLIIEEVIWCQGAAAK